VHEQDVALAQMVRVGDLLLGVPRDGVTADAVVARHVDAIRTLPVLTVKQVDTQHLCVVSHNGDPSCEPTSLLFCEA